jgi:hypothetical protein
MITHPPAFARAECPSPHYLTALLLFLLMLLLAACAPKPAMIATRPAAVTATRILRAYDLRDLLVQPDNEVQPPIWVLAPVTTNAATQPSPAPVSGLFTPSVLPKPGSRTAAVAQIIDAIKRKIEPDSWGEAGESRGTIRELNGQFIINQTSENHRAIEQLIGLLRQDRSLQVALEFRILLLDEPTFKDLSDARIVGMDSAPSPRIPGPSADPLPTGRLSNERFKELMRIAGESKNTTLLRAARTTIFSGQAAHALAGTPIHRNLNADASDFEEVSTTDSAVFIACEATVSADRRYIVSNVELVVRQLAPAGAPPAPATQAATNTDAALTCIHELLSIPDGAIAFACGTAKGPIGNLNIPPNDPRHVLLLIRPKLIIENDAR